MAIDSLNKRRVLLGLAFVAGSTKDVAYRKSFLGLLDHDFDPTPVSPQTQIRLTKKGSYNLRESDSSIRLGKTSHNRTFYS